MSSPPVGTVTLVMTDIEGSTRLWEKHGDGFITLLEEHNRCIRESLSGHGGFEVKTEGDSFFYVFETAHEALAGSVQMQRALTQANLGIRVRAGIHTGEPTMRESDYFGPQVSRTQRIRDAAHGSMTLLSGSTRALVQDHLPPNISLLDRGEHRLRDLGAPERLYQVLDPELPHEFPPLRTLEAQPNNLPAQRTSFVGREQELNLLHELLTQMRARLITLTGPGGVGKTRLALQVAADHLIDFPDGVWFIPLAAVRDPAQVMQEIACIVLGQMPAPDEIYRSLMDHLRDKRVLLVIDSFEHLLPAAAALGEMLAALPRFHCLITSHALLHLSGEYEFTVSSLADAESLELFLERGQAARPGFEMGAHNMRSITSICQQLDGLPLAIELAAARLRGMSPTQIAQRLEHRFDILSGGGRDLPDRQRTMRAALDWSYELLSPEEKELFSQLSVFVGGFFLEAAEEVCDTNDVLNGVFNLRDRSLLETTEELGETRYRMLTLVREYAAEKAEGMPALRARHAEHYLRVARQWGRQVNGREQRKALVRLDLEIANLEAALRWADESHDWRLVAEFIGALGEYAYTRGRITPFTFEVATRAAEALVGSDDSASQATLLFAAGAMAWMQDRFEEGETCVATSLKYFLSHGLQTRACRALSLLGLIAADQGRADLARKRFHEGLEICREEDHRIERALLLQNLSRLEMRQGNDAEAKRVAEECLRLNQSLGDEVGSSYQMHTLGLTAWRRGDHAEGSRWLLESLRIREQYGDLPGLAQLLCDVARQRLTNGDVENAALLGLAAHRLATDCLLPLSSEDTDTCEAVRQRLDAKTVERLTAQAGEISIPDLSAHVREMLEEIGKAG
jgi:predicted ATPase